MFGFTDVEKLVNLRRYHKHDMIENFSREKPLKSTKDRLLETGAFDRAFCL